MPCSGAGLVLAPTVLTESDKSQSALQESYMGPPVAGIQGRAVEAALRAGCSKQGDKIHARGATEGQEPWWTGAAGTEGVFISSHQHLAAL